VQLCDGRKKHLFYRRQHKEPSPLRLHDRRRQPVCTLEKPPSFGLTATADGETVVFPQTDRDRNELVLVENFAE